MKGPLPLPIQSASLSGRRGELPLQSASLSGRRGGGDDAPQLVLAPPSLTKPTINSSNPFPAPDIARLDIFLQNLYYWFFLMHHSARYFIKHRILMELKYNLYKIRRKYILYLNYYDKLTRGVLYLPMLSF